jgi:hypothetical protein
MSYTNDTEPGAGSYTNELEVTPFPNWEQTEETWDSTEWTWAEAIDNLTSDSEGSGSYTYDNKP